MPEPDETKADVKPAKAPPVIPPGVECLLGRDQVRAAIGVSMRTLQAMVSAGQFPRPDLRIGTTPKWRSRSVNDWIEARAREQAEVYARIDAYHRVASPTPTAMPTKASNRPAPPASGPPQPSGSRFSLDALRDKLDSRKR